MATSEMISVIDSKTQLRNEEMDFSLIEFNLSLTYEGRLINHQRALNTVNELVLAGAQFYGKPQSSSEAPSGK